MKFAESFGIKDEVIRKGVISTGGNDAAAKVAEGKADIAIVPITDIHAKEAKLVGPLPEPIQLWTVYAAAIPHKQRRSRGRARLRRGDDRTGDARSLGQGRLAAGEVTLIYRAGSSCSLSNSLRAASGVIGSPNTKPCAYSQPSW